MNETSSITLGDRRLWAAVAQLKIDSSRGAIDSYMNALVNLEFTLAHRTIGKSVEFKFIRYPELDGECLPVFSDDASWQAFRQAYRPLLQGYNEVCRMSAVNVYQFVAEELKEVSTVLIDPVRPDFLRVPRSTILILAQSQWKPNRSV